MEDKLRVLHVEDNPADAALIKRLLKVRWPALEVDVAENGPAFDAAICTGNWDAVLMDFNVPNFNIFDSIRETRNTNFDGPVIVLSGFIKTEQAVELLRAGANDFVAKDDMARLVPALDRELKDQEVRRSAKLTEQAFIESARRLHSIFDSALDAFVAVDEAGCVLEFNPAAISMFQVDRTQAIGKRLSELIIPADLRDQHDQGFSAFIATGHPTIPHNLISTEAMRADGERFPIELSISVGQMDSKRVLTGIIRDVSARTAMEMALNESNRKIREALIATIDVLSRTIERRDPYTAGHQKRVAELCVAIGKEIGLQEDEIFGIQMGALIHDIGKIHIPGEILTRPGRFSEEEYNIIKTHSKVGFDILKDIDLPWPVAEMVVQHHEKLDGSGYPAGLSGEEICTGARIIAVADIVEAITMQRPYRKALGIDVAIDEIVKLKGKALDPVCVDACIKLFQDDGFQFTDPVFN